MKAFLFCLATVALVAAVPALYFGAWLMAQTDKVWLFPIPAMLCMVITAMSISKAERI